MWEKGDTFPGFALIEPGYKCKPIPTVQHSAVESAKVQKSSKSALNQTEK